MGSPSHADASTVASAAAMQAGTSSRRPRRDTTPSRPSAATLIPHEVRAAAPGRQSPASCEASPSRAAPSRRADWGSPWRSSSRPAASQRNSSSADSERAPQRAPVGAQVRARSPACRCRSAITARDWTGLPMSTSVCATRWETAVVTVASESVHASASRRSGVPSVLGMDRGDDDRNAREPAAGARQHRARVVESGQGRRVQRLHAPQETRQDTYRVHGRLRAVQVRDRHTVFGQLGAVIVERQHADDVHVEAARTQPRRRRGTAALRRHPWPGRWRRNRPRAAPAARVRPRRGMAWDEVST